MTYRPLPDDAGYSLVDVLVTAALGVTVMAIFAGFFPQAVATVQGDADMRVLQYHLKLARETAINQRRDIQLQFVGTNTLQLVRTDLPTGSSVIATAVLEHGTEFRLFPGLPDTPDAFGNGAAVWFGGASPVMFTAEGMVTDTIGNVVNGSLFIGQPNRPMTARAITLFGPTATISSYRWNGSSWRR
jgi:hypothetical protein